MGEIAVVGALLLANGVFALAEIAVVSARKPRLQAMADAGSRGARRALELAKDPERFLSTVQVGITLVGIFAGAYGGASLSDDLALGLARFESLSPYQPQIAFGVVVAAITYFSLVIGELLPKRIALSNPERFACAMAPVMGLLATVGAPLVWLLSASTGFLMRLLPIAEGNESAVTEEEVNVMVRQGAEAGVFTKTESELVARALNLGDRPVRQLMTPRMDVVWLDAKDPFRESLRQMTDSGFSNFPVCGANADDVIGILTLKCAWRYALSGEDQSVATSAVPGIIPNPLWVADSLPASEMLEMLRKNRTHFALVQDEYGGMAGIVTDHDLLEALVGHLAASAGGEDQPYHLREDGSYLLNGWMDLGDLASLLGVPTLPQSVREEYSTVAGFVLDSLRRMARTGDTFERFGWKFEVVDLDGNRIDKVLASRTA